MNWRGSTLLRLEQQHRAFKGLNECRFRAGVTSLMSGRADGGGYGYIGGS